MGRRHWIVARRRRTRKILPPTINTHHRGRPPLKCREAGKDQLLCDGTVAQGHRLFDEQNQIKCFLQPAHPSYSTARLCSILDTTMIVLNN
eukprot:scaffold1237_cov243-Pinguiococcus_pyrenoidosus.AAC.9